MPSPVPPFTTSRAQASERLSTPNLYKSPNLDDSPNRRADLGVAQRGLHWVAVAQRTHRKQRLAYLRCSSWFEVAYTRTQHTIGVERPEECGAHIVLAPLSSLRRLLLSPLQLQTPNNLSLSFSTFLLIQLGHQYHLTTVLKFSFVLSVIRS